MNAIDNNHLILSYCKAFDIPIDVYQIIFNCLSIDGDGHPCVPSRYFTLNRFKITAGSDSDEDLLKEVPCRKVSWLPGFYCMDGRAKISHFDVYKKNYLLCMDISSAVAVDALDLEPGHHVLDLCCSPGTLGFLFFDADVTHLRVVRST